jgi:hypothetical protein
MSNVVLPLRRGLLQMPTADTCVKWRCHQAYIFTFLIVGKTESVVINSAIFLSPRSRTSLSSGPLVMAFHCPPPYGPVSLPPAQPAVYRYSIGMGHPRFSVLTNFRLTAVLYARQSLKPRFKRDAILAGHQNYDIYTLGLLYDYFITIVLIDATRSSIKGNILIY